MRANANPVPNPPPRRIEPRVAVRNTTNSEKYRSEPELIEMLRRVGVNQAGIDQLLSDDFDTMEVLVEQYKDNINEFTSYLKTINKSNSPVRFSPVVSNRITAVLHLFIQATSCFHMIPDISIIGRDEATSLIEPYNAYNKFNATDADEDIIIELPDLKGHDNWIQYRDKFLSNLNNMIGSNGTPLSYVVDDTEREITNRNHPLIEVLTVDLNSWDTYKEGMVHFGAHFKRDNAKIWQLLKKSLLGSQPYHHIDHCSRQENGRKAWATLRSYYEGQDFVNKTIQECLTKVRTMYYRGESPRFNFEKFVDLQKECYKRLRDVGYNEGRGLDDASKCSNLKQMILPEAQLETALSMARTQGLFSGPFDDLIHFLKAEVDELTLRKTQQRSNRSHRVSSVGFNRNNGGRGSHQGRGGRGGRGSGRGNQYNNRSRSILTRVVDGRQVHSGNYSQREYMRLTPSQREAVKALRRQMRQQLEGQGSQWSERRTNISSVTFSDDAADPGGNNDNESTHLPTNASMNSAQSGSVGSYLGNRRNNRNSSQSE